MKKQILLAIDIGNTNVVMGVFKGSRLISKRYVPTEKAARFKDCQKVFQKIHRKKTIEAVIISSVVPRALRSVKKCSRNTFGGRVFVLGENIKAPIKNRYKRPGQVGQDRLANGVAMHSKYGGGIVVDFGTAVTFDLISKSNEYLGGVIFPGIRLSLENLSLKAALLPRIELKAARSLIGRDTAESMRGGIVYGYGALCDGIINRLKRRYAKRLPVVATGGDARLLARFSRSIDKVDPELTLQGLAITYLAYSQKNT